MGQHTKLQCSIEDSIPKWQCQKWNKIQTDNAK